MSRSKFDYIIGVIFALTYSVFSAMKYISIRAIGDDIHTSVKNYYFGVMGGIFTLVVNIFL